MKKHTRELSMGDIPQPARKHNRQVSMADVQATLDENLHNSIAEDVEAVEELSEEMDALDQNAEEIVEVAEPTQ